MTNQQNRDAVQDRLEKAVEEAVKRTTRNFSELINGKQGTEGRVANLFLLDGLLSALAKYSNEANKPVRAFPPIAIGEGYLMPLEAPAGSVELVQDDLRLTVREQPNHPGLLYLSSDDSGRLDPGFVTVVLKSSKWAAGDEVVEPSEQAVVRLSAVEVD